MIYFLHICGQVHEIVPFAILFIFVAYFGYFMNYSVSPKVTKCCIVALALLGLLLIVVPTKNVVIGSYMMSTILEKTPKEFIEEHKNKNVDINTMKLYKEYSDRWIDELIETEKRRGNE